MNPRVLALSNKMRIAYNKQTGVNAPLLDNLVKSDMVLVEFLINCSKINPDLAKLVDEMKVMLGWDNLDQIRAKLIAKQATKVEATKDGKSEGTSGNAATPKTYLGSLR